MTRIQAQLAAWPMKSPHNGAPWRRQQYLKGSVFCERCGERLGFGHSTGRGREYAYFFCLGRHRRRTGCDLPYIGSDKVEAAVQRVWSGRTFTPELVTRTIEVVNQEFDALQTQDVISEGAPLVKAGS